MSTVKQISQILEEEKALKLVTEAYGELAGTKLKKIRSDIEQTRVFFIEISKVFAEVKNLASKQGVLPEAKTLPTAEVIITSNSRFYGALENDLIRFFLSNSQDASAHRFFVGKTAEDFFRSRPHSPQDKFIKFHADLPSYEELKSLTTQLVQFQKILVYHPRFQSVLIQKPTLVDITQTPSSAKSFQDTIENINFIFEPELDKILRFFDSQITSILVQQVFLEAELARTAARLISMDQAQQRADESIRLESTNLKIAQRQLENMKLLETISSIFGWRKVAPHA